VDRAVDQPEQGLRNHAREDGLFHLGIAPGDRYADGQPVLPRLSRPCASASRIRRISLTTNPITAC
jgi:hypothetical protein